jgi:hypothetical protein
MTATYLLGDTFEQRSNQSNAAGAATTQSLLDHQACCREILRLTRENARLTDELARASATNEDLARSTAIWIRLYEAQLARARQPQLLHASSSAMERSRS